MIDGAVPDIHECEATTEEVWIDFKGRSRGISIQNTGPMTLWISMAEREKDEKGEYVSIEEARKKKKTWIYVASGTSCGGEKVVARGLWCCTQTGWTTFVVSRIPY